MSRRSEVAAGAGAASLVWQPSLLGGGAIAGDATFAGVTRRELADGAWVDHGPGWLGGADELFAELLELPDWGQHDRWMYDRRVTEPRLTASWRLGRDAVPLPVLAGLSALLGERYRVAFTQLGANLYRDGADSVAWHGDRVARELPDAVVALLSLGATRPFRLRPKGGGPSLTYLPGHGDLLVMGGSCQRTWDHAVPKVRAAGPRISVQLRQVYDHG